MCERLRLYLYIVCSYLRSLSEILFFFFFLSYQVTLDVQREVGVSTKGPRGGVFVMYNCARLHTLFSSYEKGVEQGKAHTRTIGLSEQSSLFEYYWKKGMLFTYLKAKSAHLNV